MKKRWRYRVATTIVGSLVLNGFWLLQLWDRGPIHYDNLDDIHLGMTKAQVVQLLGCSPGNHATGQVHLKQKLGDGSDAYLPAGQDFEWPTGAREMTYIWLGDRGAIGVTFDLLADRVSQKVYVEGRDCPATCGSPLSVSSGAMYRG